MSAKDPGTDASFDWLRHAHRSEPAPAALRRHVLSRGVHSNQQRKAPRRWLARSAPLALAAAFAGALWFGASRHAPDGSGNPAPTTHNGVVPTAEPGTPANATRSAAPSEPSRACPKPLPYSPWNPSELGEAARFNGLQVQVFQTETAGCGSLVRRYLVRLPAQRAEAAPALIVLHDAGQSADEALLPTRWWFGELARRTSNVLVYANGGPIAADALGGAKLHAGVWQTDEGAHPAVDDLAYLQGIVDDLRARGSLGQGAEVFLAGYGSGAIMALAAARQHPERYTGVAAFLPAPLPRAGELGSLGAAPRGTLLGPAAEWRLRSVFIALPSSAGADPSALARQWAEAFGSEPGGVQVTRQKPGLQRIDTSLRGGLPLRILLLAKQVDPFPLPGGGDETARTASMARPFFFDGPGAAWDFFQGAKP